MLSIDYVLLSVDNMLVLVHVLICFIHFTCRDVKPSVFLKETDKDRAMGLLMKKTPFIIPFSEVKYNFFSFDIF